MARAEVIANPAADEVFVGTVRRLAHGESDPETFERRLRRHYPNARVRQSVISGSDGERWYVYRDGAWIGDSTRAVGAAE